MGDTTPYLGLGCDRVLELETVLYNGTLVRANKGECWRHWGRLHWCLL